MKCEVSLLDRRSRVSDLDKVMFLSTLLFNEYSKTMVERMRRMLNVIILRDSNKSLNLFNNPFL